MEGGENLTLLQIVKEKPKSKSEIIDFREKQTYGSRLAEYLTGLRPDDPKMAARLIEDQKIVRGKYGLPDWFLRYDDVTEYANCLSEIIKKEDINVRPTVEYMGLFDEFRVTAASLGEKNIVIDVNNRDGVEEYGKSLQNLEHELVHSLQAKRYPKMTVEQIEYEAYVSEKPVMVFEISPEYIEESFFGFSFRSSIEGVYRCNNEMNGTDLKPPWEDPEYFLKNVDGFSDKEIADYKQEYKKTEKVSEENSVK